MVDSVSVRFKNACVEKVPLNIRIQWNAGTACVSECVLKTLACRGFACRPFQGVHTKGAQRAQRSKKFEISIENEIFDRATHRGPIFCGEIETSRLKFSSDIKKTSIEIENFDRDQIFLIVGHTKGLSCNDTLHRRVLRRCLLRTLQ